MKNHSFLLMLFLLNAFYSIAQQNYVLDWATNIGAISDNYGFEVITDNNQNTYITGTFRGTQDFGGITLNALPTADFFIAKYDPSGNLLWVNQGGGTSDWYEEGRAMVVDANENVYVTGNFFGSGTFNGLILDSFGDYDAFVAKYDADGNLVWLKQMGGIAVDLGKELALDSAGNLVCLTKAESSQVTFETSVLENDNTNGSLFISKFTPDGNLIFAKQVVSNPFSNFFGFEVDSNNDILISGNIFFAGSFQGNPFNSFGGNDGFLAKYNTEGNLIWVRQIAGEEDIICTSLCLDPNDNIYLTGDFKGQANFGNISTSSDGEEDIFIAKFDGSGQPVWARSAGDGNRDKSFDIGYSTDDELFVLGRFQNSIIFENQTLSSNGLWDIFLARYDTDGNHIQSENFGGDGESFFEDRAWGINIGLNNSVAITGNFNGEINLGTDTLISNGQHDIYVIKWKIDDMVSIEAFDEMGDDFTFYPNPTSNLVTLTFEKSYKNTLIQVTSIDGKLMATFEFSDNETIEFSLPTETGTYLITGRIDDLELVGRKIVRR